MKKARDKKRGLSASPLGVCDRLRLLAQSLSLDSLYLVLILVFFDGLHELIEKSIDLWFEQIPDCHA